MGQCFPWLRGALNRVSDPRDDPHYSMAQVLTLGILMFACRLRGLRALDRVSHDAVFRDNWNALSGACTETVMCSRQMTNVLAVIDPEEVARLRVRMIRGLQRAKRIPRAQLLGHMMAASDGTGVFASSEPHCSRCLVQNHADGSKTYLHNVLETKVVTWDGLALSLLTEPLLNPEDGRYDKQDCETKAFKRMLPGLKEEFPRQPIVHLLDALYAQGPCLKAIDALGHKVICGFKPGCIPTLYEEALELKKLVPDNRVVLTRNGERLVYTWVNGLAYNGLRLDFVMCERTRNGKTTLFTFLTNFHVTQGNVEIIAEGGRLRWTIENEGFNEQKTGYALEHFCDCNSFEVMYALYLLLQIAHACMQLLARSSLIKSTRNLAHLAHLLLEALRNQRLTGDPFVHRGPPFQIRFSAQSP
jgi:hypothetical protein